MNIFNGGHMIKNIILDMGNVLMDYNPDVILNQSFDDRESQEQIKKELFHGPEWVEGDKGLLTDEEIYKAIRGRIPESLHAGLFNCVMNWDICMVPLPGAKELCRQVKEKGYGLYVLSNASPKFYTYFPKEFPLEQFDGILTSSEVHLVKPDIGIYQHFLQKFSLNAEECLFVDDRKNNVDAAISAGMKGLQFTGDYNKIWQFIEEDENTFSTTTKQLRITDTVTGENQVFSPSIYQSCMHPEEIKIYEMTVRKFSETEIEIQTHYGTWNVSLEGKKVEISPWKGEIHKVDCKKCENCGRCGW